MKKYLIILVVFLVKVPLFGQYWRTFTNPLYKIHWNLNDNQKNKAQKLILKRKLTADTLHPIYWHSLTRLQEDSSHIDIAITYARKAVLSMDLWKKNTKAYDEFRKIYFFDAYYLDLYYRKLLYQKYEQERSLISPKINSELLGFYMQESQQIIDQLDLQNINRRITFPHITESLTALNDTIEFNRLMNQRNPSRIGNYLKQLGVNDQQVNALPKHLKSFYLQAKDSFYSWTFEAASQIHNEKTYLEFAQKYPDAPQTPLALQNADELAFSFSRTQHTAEHYEAYLKNYPYGKYKKQAKLLLRYLVVVPVPYSKADGKYIFVDSLNMRPWIDSTYDFAYPFSLKHHTQWTVNGATLISGCALVMKKDEFDRNQWYYIEKDGTPFNDKTYDEIRQIHPYRAIVTKSNHYGLIDQHGRELLPPIFKKIHIDTSHQIAMVYNGEFWALFNTQFGKRLTKFEFSQYRHLLEKNQADIDVLIFSNNRIVVQKDLVPMLIDFEGNPYFVGNFSQLEPFFNGVAIAKLPNKKSILIDTLGNAYSDTFVQIENCLPGKFYKIETEDKKIKFGLLSADSANKKFKGSKIKSEKPIEFAWYGGMPHFLAEVNGESRIYNALDSIVFQSKGVDIKSHASDIFVQNVRKNPKTKSGPWLKKWFNPYQKTFSQISAEEIGILMPEILVVYDNKRARLYQVNEQEIPLFQEDSSLKQVNEVREIFSLNAVKLFVARTDSAEAIIDPTGRVLVPFAPGNIEDFGAEIFTRTSEKGMEILNLKNKKRYGPFEEIQEDGFEGYWLIKKDERWMWLDAKERLFGESI